MGVTVAEMRAFEAAVRMLGYEPVTFEIRSAGDIAPAFDALKGEVDALDLVPEGLALRIEFGSSRLRWPHVFRQFTVFGNFPRSAA
jgi:hypothetical protein